MSTVNIGDGNSTVERNNEAMLDMISELQSSRMETQRAELSGRSGGGAGAGAGAGVAGRAGLPGLRGEAPRAPDDDLLDMIARVQGSRLDEQRTALPRAPPAAPAPTPATPATPAAAAAAAQPPPPPAASTVPDDDFFALLMRAQATRMEDQRATIPLQENRQNKSAKK